MASARVITIFLFSSVLAGFTQVVLAGENSETSAKDNMHFLEEENYGDIEELKEVHADKEGDDYLPMKIHGEKVETTAGYHGANASNMDHKGRRLTDYPYRLTYLQQYCDNAICFTGGDTWCPKQNKAMTTQACANTVAAQGSGCSNYFHSSAGSSGTGACYCAGAGKTCIPKADTRFTVYALNTCGDLSCPSGYTKKSGMSNYYYTKSTCCDASETCASCLKKEIKATLEKCKKSGRKAAKDAMKEQLKSNFKAFLSSDDIDEAFSLASSAAVTGSKDAVISACTDCSGNVVSKLKKSTCEQCPGGKAALYAAGVALGTVDAEKKCTEALDAASDVATGGPSPSPAGAKDSAYRLTDANMWCSGSGKSTTHCLAGKAADCEASTSITSQACANKVAAKTSCGKFFYSSAGSSGTGTCTCAEQECDKKTSTKGSDVYSLTSTAPSPSSPTPSASTRRRRSRRRASTSTSGGGEPVVSSAMQRPCIDALMMMSMSALALIQ
jgi:hypothetical protein